MMIKNKNVLILAASVTTGYTASSAIEAIKYYGGTVAGVCSIFATVSHCNGYEVHSVFNPTDLEGYASYPANVCPMCQRGERIDALVNSFGYSKI
jgi:orotate phosphoribosyltransferase